MNYKLLFPSYRTRYLFVQATLEQLSRAEVSRRTLNVGCGEGDYDSLIAGYTGRLDSCDVNDRDVDYARQLNRELVNVSYSVNRAEQLDFAAGTFDTVVCLEVIEHVADPQTVLAELFRVLRPGGHLILTCPSRRFPFSYDPCNHVLRRWERKLPVGAYGFGHSWLVDEEEMSRWLTAAGLQVTHRERLSRHLVGLLECYWPGVAQRLVKANAKNAAEADQRRFELRPTEGTSSLQPLTDALIRIDRRLFASTVGSIGLGYIAQRPVG